MRIEKYCYKDQKQPFITFYDNSMVEIPNRILNPCEVKGIWVSTVSNIDIPVLEKEKYQEYLKDMIARINSYGINTIIFQVRPSSDAYYPSKLNPWSRFITGVEGKDPGFDVLGFVIDEAKKYNIKVHAWLNPYRVSNPSLKDKNMTKEEFLNTLSDLNFAKRHPELTIVDGIGKVILKPSSPKVIDFITDTVLEIVVNYDVEGIHMDDYFYPYAPVPYEEEEEDFKNHRKEHGEIDFSDWRRSNVDRMVESIHLALKNLNRKVQFGISPFGIYRTHSSIKENGWEKGSFHSPKALQCYTDLYSDIYKWMEKHWIDYIVPQVYFPFERKDVTYHDLTLWWCKRASETNTTLYIGQGLYQMGKSEAWQNPKEILHQLLFNSQFPEIKGTIFFTYHDLIPGQNDIKDNALQTIKELWT